MAIYESIPSECEAKQWTGPDGSLVPGVQVGRTLTGMNRYYVMTAHGQAVYIVPGDVIVKEPNGDGLLPGEAGHFSQAVATEARYRQRELA